MAPRSDPVPSAPDERDFLVGELTRRHRPARIALLLDPPEYLTAEFGPVPTGSATGAAG